MRTYCLAIVVLSVTLAAQPSSKFRKVDSYITNGVRNAAMFDFQPRIPSTVAERSLTGGVGATLTFTSAMGGCPWGVNGSDTSHSLYISGGTGTAEAVTITGGTCVAGATSGTITFTPANTHSGQWTIRSATGGVREALQDLPSDGGSVLASNLVGVTMRGDPLGGITKPFVLKLGGIANVVQRITTDVTWNLTRSGQRIVGESSSGVVILASSSFPASSSFTITDCTNATPIVCTTSAAHGYSAGNSVHVSSVGGNTAANGSWDLSAVTATTITLRGSVGSGAYTSGGSVVKVTPIIKMVNAANPIFSSEIRGVTLVCSTDATPANVRTGCAGIYASGLQNQALIEDVWVYAATSGFWLSTGSNNVTDVQMNRNQVVGLVTGFVGFTVQAELTNVYNSVCDADDVQGQTCIRWMSTGTIVGVLSEETTDVIYQSPNTTLTAINIRGVDHDAPNGKDTVNVFHSATREYVLIDIAATQVSGTTPVILKDDATPYTLSSIGTLPFMMNGSNTPTFPTGAYFGVTNYGVADTRSRIVLGADPTNSIQIRGYRPGGPTGGKGWYISPGGTQADSNPSAELGSCDIDFSTNCHTFFKADVNSGTGYNVNIDPAGTENTNVGGTLKVGKNVLLASKTNAQLGAEANGSIYYCSDCTIASPCAGGGTGALAKKIAGAWVCN